MRGTEEDCKTSAIVMVLSDLCQAAACLVCVRIAKISVALVKSLPCDMSSYTGLVDVGSTYAAKLWRLYSHIC